MLNKKAAMFGLDARIALAIFGALSVITGAALYSAIQDAKTIRLVTQINEIQKAYESYYLDTGVQIRKIGDVVPTHTNKAYGLNLRDLVFDSGVKGWKGPYFNASFKDSDGNPVDNFGYDKIAINMSMIEDSTWPANSAPACSAASGVKCKVWISVWSDNSQFLESVTKELDTDGNDSIGKVRTTTAHSEFVFINTGIVYKF